jgi:hypothetical protein
MLLAGGQAQANFVGEQSFFMRRFGRDGRNLGEDIPSTNHSIFDIRGCGDGFIFASVDPAFGRLRRDGKATKLQGQRTADLRSKFVSAFALSPEATTVRFGLGYGDTVPVVFDIVAATLADSPDEQAALSPPLVDGLSVSTGAKIMPRSFAVRHLYCRADRCRVEAVRRRVRRQGARARKFRKSGPNGATARSCWF